MNKMKKLWWTMFVLCFCCIGASAQKTIDVTGDIMDEYLNMPLKDVKISLLNPDSTVVVDSATTTYVTGTNGKLLQVVYNIPVKAEERDFLIRATRPGYNEVWQPITVRHVDLISAVRVPTIKMRKEMSLALSEVKVTATKVKMYYKGDTLVYDADAFKLPDGSMLDALIRQLPGVTLNDAGEIFVNGRKVDELLLGSRTFFRGNKKVLMENLPYYTVKDLKVYEKQTDMSEALGYDVEPRRYVMDVNLRPEYSHGYIANVEAAGRTAERYLGRAFLLGFTDRWRYSLLANLNNVNETRHVGEQGHWTPARMPQSMITTRSVATDLDYQSADKQLSNNLSASFTSTTNRQQTNRRYEQFLEGSKPTSFTTSANRSGSQQYNIKNDLVLKKPCYINVETDFNYFKHDGSFRSAFEQWDDSLTASMRTVGMSEGRNVDGKLTFSTAFNVGKKAENCEGGNCNNEQQRMSLQMDLYYKDECSEQASRYDTRQLALSSRELQHNANDYRNREMYGVVLANYFTRIYNQTGLQIGWTSYYLSRDGRDYLYHPDTLMLASQIDALTAITDPDNSYDSRFSRVHNELGITLFKDASYKISPNFPMNISYRTFELGVHLPAASLKLDYQRGSLDTLVHRTRVFANPFLSYRYMSKDGKRDFRVYASPS